MSRILLSCFILVLLGFSLQAGGLVLQPASRQHPAHGQIQQYNQAGTPFFAEAEWDEDEDCGHNQRLQTLRKGIIRNALVFQEAFTGDPYFDRTGSLHFPTPTARYLLLCHFRM